jgi:hypothetical protein
MARNPTEALGVAPSTTNKAPPSWNYYCKIPPEYNDYNPASHLPCLVPTYEQNQQPNRRDYVHRSTPSRNCLLFQAQELSSPMHYPFLSWNRPPFLLSIKPRSLSSDGQSTGVQPVETRGRSVSLTSACSLLSSYLVSRSYYHPGSTEPPL